MRCHKICFDAEIREIIPNNIGYPARLELFRSANISAVDKEERYLLG